MSAWTFRAIEVRHGTPACRVLEFLWDDGTPREMTGTGYLRVYQARGGDLLFPEVELAAGDDLAHRVLNLTAEQCTQARSVYYAEIEFRDGGAVVPDSGWFGTLSIAGK